MCVCVSAREQKQRLDCNMQQSREEEPGCESVALSPPPSFPPLTDQTISLIKAGVGNTHLLANQ